MPLKSRNAVVGMAALLVGTIVIYLYSTNRDMPSESAASGSATLDVVNDSAKANVATQPTPDATPIPVLADRPKTLVDRYVQSFDLFALAEQLRADADAGNAEAARIIAMIVEECSHVAADPQILDFYKAARENFTDEEKKAFLVHRAKGEQRCAGFLASGKIVIAASSAEQQRAAELNDLSAQAVRLAHAVGVRRLDDDANHALTQSEIELARTIALSGDVEAIAAMAWTQNDQLLGRRYAQTYANVQTNQLAWELVACDLGRDCGSNGFVMRNLCLGFNQCISGSYRDYFRRRQVAPDKYQAVLAREREILQAIKSGDVSTVIP